MTQENAHAALALVPRYRQQGYSEQDVQARRRWLEAMCSTNLDELAIGRLPTESMRGNIENPVGSVQMPLGISGPMLVNGIHARGLFYVPLATTEGALVRSYERGMVTTARSGGVTVRVIDDENSIVPVFHCETLIAALELCEWIRNHFDVLATAADATTGHGRLVATDSIVTGKDVYVRFRYTVGDAHGMNMITRATHAACQCVRSHCPYVRGFLVTTGACSEKRASGALFTGGKGKRTVAEAVLQATVLRTHLRVTPEQMLNMWHSTFTAQAHSHSTGYNGHFANGLTAMFIALGQDVANVTNSAVGLTSFSITDAGDLYMSIVLPSLTVATVGGGTGLPTSQACLRILGCCGSGKALRLAELVGATVLCGELSMGAAIASGEFTAAHERYGRNRPASMQASTDMSISEVIA